MQGRRHLLFGKSSLPALKILTVEMEKHMHNAILSLYMKLRILTNSEEGQDLVEYALLVALVALACITGVNRVASAVSAVFTDISSSLA